MKPTTCDDCGVCCVEQCSPPGYLFLLCQPDRADEWPDAEDIERVKNLPHNARLAIDRYRKALAKRGSLTPDGPCCWLDLRTMRCLWYEHRPQICRDFERGSEGCKSWRDDYNVDVLELVEPAE